MPYELTGTAVLKNGMLFPFNDSRRLIVFPQEAPDCGYSVNTEVISSDGDVTDVAGTDRALNGFFLAFEGTATRAEIRYTVSSSHPLGGACPPAEYELSGNILSIRGGELSLDLSRYERDHEMRIVIGEDMHGALTMGPAHRYLMEITVPPRTYTYEKGAADDIGLPRLYREPSPFDPSKVAITVFSGKAVL